MVKFSSRTKQKGLSRQVAITEVISNSVSYIQDRIFNCCSSSRVTITGEIRACNNTTCLLKKFYATVEQRGRLRQKNPFQYRSLLQKHAIYQTGRT